VYKIQISKTATKFLSKVPKKDQEKIAIRIKELSNDPRSDEVIKLTNIQPDTYRARQGDYRIKFHIHDEILIIDVIDIDHRKDVYRR
jgi:mRNA interferase RelE/StbE